MPLYDAQCPSCGKTQEYSASIKTFEQDTPTCECGTRMSYKFAGNGGGFILNGAGWPGQTIKRRNEHEKAVRTPVKEFLDKGGRNLK